MNYFKLLFKLCNLSPKIWISGSCGLASWPMSTLKISQVGSSPARVLPDLLVWTFIYPFLILFLHSLPLDITALCIEHVIKHSGNCSKRWAWTNLEWPFPWFSCIKSIACVWKFQGDNWAYNIPQLFKPCQHATAEVRPELNMELCGESNIDSPSRKWQQQQA